MSVLVKGMKMPETCWRCRLFVPDDEEGDGYCCVARQVVECPSFTIPEWCPLVEVPTPHGRLIDASVNPENYVEVWECMCTEYGTQTVMAVDDMQYFPVIIEAEERT